MSGFVNGLLQSVFSIIGLNTPLKRLLGTAAGGTFAEFMLKPPYAFDEDGRVRPWGLVAQEPGSTFMPVGFLPSLLGAIFMLFF